MLLSGINHVAVLTQDTERFHSFYGEVFGATVFADQVISDGGQEGRLSFVTIGEHTQFNVFELPDATPNHAPMFGRGPIDHIGLQAESQEAFDEIRRRLIERGRTDGFVTDFGVGISLFFIDPDGLEGEVVLDTPGTGPADIKPPGTPAAGYERVLPEM
ncbi:MAG TPA: VOC family protein [Acidimicrobiia bacterium]|jgi:catechol 2,3-dioxygenase-like lactoylglutathione lyase family enzyme